MSKQLTINSCTQCPHAHQVMYPAPMYPRYSNPEAVIRYCCKASQLEFIAYGEISEGIVDVVKIPGWCPL